MFWLKFEVPVEYIGWRLLGMMWAWDSLALEMKYVRFMVCNLSIGNDHFTLEMKLFHIHINGRQTSSFHRRYIPHD